MNKIEKAVQHLAQILPLQEKFKHLDDRSRKIYQQALTSFVVNGKPLSIQADQQPYIDRLSEDGMLILDDSGKIEVIYPFCVTPRNFNVKVNGYSIQTMCALDALAVSPMFDTATEIYSSCAVSGDDIIIRQNNKKVLNTEVNQHLYFGINWGRADNRSCAETLCTEMLYIKGRQTAARWQESQATNREIFTLDQAIHFAADFFMPLMQQKSIKAW